MRAKLREEVKDITLDAIIKSEGHLGQAAKLLGLSSRHSVASRIASLRIEGQVARIKETFAKVKACRKPLTKAEIARAAEKKAARIAKVNALYLNQNLAGLPSSKKKIFYTEDTSE